MYCILFAISSAWFDVQREGKIGYSEAQVVELDLDSNVKRVKFTFYRLKSDRDEWVEVGSPRIAPHHSYTPRPFIGGASSKKVDTSAGAKRKVDDVESKEDSAKSLIALSSKPIKDYLNTWMSLHPANPIPNSLEKLKIMSDTGLSESQLDEWMRTRKKPKKKKDDGLTDEQRKEKELKKKMNEDMNNFLSAWLLRPENVQANPIAAATPTAETKEWMAKQLGVDRARIDSWFYRRRKKLKKQHMPNNSLQAPNNLSAGSISQPQSHQQQQVQQQQHLQLQQHPQQPQPQQQPQPKAQTVPASTSTIAKHVVPTSQNQFAMNPNLNLPSNHQRPQNQTALTASTQVSMSVNQQLQSNGQSHVAVSEAVGAKSSSNGAPVSKQSGLSEEAKQYLTQWLLKTSNPYPSKEMKDKIMAHFGIENTRTLDGFLTRTRKKLNLQNKQTVMKVTQSHPAVPTAATRPGSSLQMNQSQHAAVSAGSRPGAGAQIYQSQASTTSTITQPNQPTLPTQAPMATSAQPTQPTQPPPSLPAQSKPTQNPTTSNVQSASSVLPMQSSSLDSLLTAVEMVNSQKQYTQPQPSRHHASNQIGQTHAAPSTSAMGSGASQHQQQQHHQQQQRFSHSPSVETSNPSRHQHQHQHMQNGAEYHSGQQRHFTHSPSAPQYQPAPTREQSILMAYQHLQEMEINDRSSRRSSPAEAVLMQNVQGNPHHHSAGNTIATSHDSQANRVNQQQDYRGIQQQYIHGRNPNN